MITIIDAHLVTLLLVCRQTGSNALVAVNFRLARDPGVTVTSYKRTYRY
jgi:hypothetical protein